MEDHDRGLVHLCPSRTTIDGTRGIAQQLEISLASDESLEQIMIWLQIFDKDERIKWK